MKRPGNNFTNFWKPIPWPSLMIWTYWLGNTLNTCGLVEMVEARPLTHWPPYKTCNPKQKGTSLALGDCFVRGMLMRYLAVHHLSLNFACKQWFNDWVGHLQRRIPLWALVDDYLLWTSENRWAARCQEFPCLFWKPLETRCGVIGTHQRWEVHRGLWKCLHCGWVSSSLVEGLQKDFLATTITMF